MIVKSQNGEARVVYGLHTFDLSKEDDKTQVVATANGFITTVGDYATPLNAKAALEYLDSQYNQGKKIADMPQDSEV